MYVIPADCSQISAKYPQEKVKNLLLHPSTNNLNHFHETCRQTHCHTEKNGFVMATKLRTTNEFFVALTKNFAAVTIRFVDRTKHFVVVTKYFGYPRFNK